jgi:DNA modification methylase
MAGVLNQKITDRYAIYNADCMDVLASIPDDSIHASIYSPPFAGLYHYSSDDRDLSNARDYDEFLDHVRVPRRREKHRVTIPGRTVGVHAAPSQRATAARTPTPTSPATSSAPTRPRGFVIARHVIWKEPLAVRNRTMAEEPRPQDHRRRRRQRWRRAADELLIFRKPGESAEPDRSTRRA